MGSIKDGKKLPRPPVVVILGHVDHGKTTLLDYLRKTNLAEKEAGGITQSIGAYEITRNDKKITFIDTPGHEAFTKMRQRGTNIADIAVLIVAADDGVKPQTEEAITILKNEGIPFIVAINKIDKNNADIEKTKQDLLSHGVMLEGFGGDVPWSAISAKTGQGVEEMLDLLLILSEMQSLEYNPNNPASGFILEAYKDPKKGIIVFAIIKDGVLKKGKHIITPSSDGLIKSIENFLGEQVNSLNASSYAGILGFNSVPLVGEKFISGDIDIIKKIDLHPIKEEKNNEELEIEKNIFNNNKNNVTNIILCADVSGSLEALEKIIKNLSSEERVINILSKKIGNITDGDVKQACPSKALIVGFNVKSTKIADNLAKSYNVKIITSNVIYKIIENLEDEFKIAKSEVNEGELEVLSIFSRQGVKHVIGGKMLKGILEKDDKFEIIRNGDIIGRGKIINLQQDKKDVKRVSSGECGLKIQFNDDIKEGDVLKVIVN